MCKIISLLLELNSSTTDVRISGPLLRPSNQSTPPTHTYQLLLVGSSGGAPYLQIPLWISFPSPTPADFVFFLPSPANWYYTQPNFFRDFSKKSPIYEATLRSE